MTILWLGLINWITTVIIVDSRLFEDYRHAGETLALRIAEKHPNIGGKIGYVVHCALCTGTWIGFIEALSFGGPFHLGWVGWIANGLLYKALGHLILEIAAIMKHMNAAYENEGYRRSW